MTPKFAVTLTVVGLILAGCGKKAGHDHDHAGHESAHHEHLAPHGGKLVEVGEHQFNLEIAHDPAAGKLTLWVLDSHAENFVRVSLPAIPVIVTAGGAEQTLSLTAVANPATGETVGDTSQFEGAAEWLKGEAVLPLRVPLLEIRGVAFRNLEATLGAPGDHDHDHEAGAK